MNLSGSVFVRSIFQPNRLPKIMERACDACRGSFCYVKQLRTIVAWGLDEVGRRSYLHTLGVIIFGIINDAALRKSKRRKFTLFSLARQSQCLYMARLTHMSQMGFVTCSV